MFPGPGAQIYRNEAGEPTGWDYPNYDPPEPDDYEGPDVFDDSELCRECGEPIYIDKQLPAPKWKHQETDSIYCLPDDEMNSEIAEPEGW